MASPSPSSEEIAKELCYKRIHIDAGTDTVKLWRIVEDDDEDVDWSDPTCIRRSDYDIWYEKERVRIEEMCEREMEVKCQLQRKEEEEQDRWFIDQLFATGYTDTYEENRPASVDELFEEWERRGRPIDPFSLERTSVQLTGHSNSSPHFLLLACGVQ